jgi:hypothetical protein
MLSLSKHLSASGKRFFNGLLGVRNEQEKLKAVRLRRNKATADPPLAEKWMATVGCGEFISEQ